MAPMIVVTDGEPRLVLGSPGGPRIISSVLQALLGVLDFGLDIQAAIALARVHHQWWPDVLYYEPDAIVADVRAVLEGMGHQLVPYAEIGSVQGIEVRRAEGGGRLLMGGSDPRRNGCAAGVTQGRIVSDCAAVLCTRGE
jgi:gamma-glutamyltranspeptidase/glutathione hydrolase